MLVIGLTGSIGMGKSTTVNMFRKLGIAVHDSDAAVHAIYSGPAALKVESEFPGVLKNGAIDRKRLGEIVFGNAQALQKLEDIIHPQVAVERNGFLEDCRSAGERMVVLDVPLFFEVGGVGMVDVIVVVSASEAIQKSRVLARHGMTEDRYNAVMSRQISDSVKRSRGHFIIDTGHGFAFAEYQVTCFLKCVGLNRVIGAN